jgi:FAD/FMN-containing dehydrogenase
MARPRSTMRAIRKHDPLNVMNPGKIFALG